MLPESARYWAVPPFLEFFDGMSWKPNLNGASTQLTANMNSSSYQMNICVGRHRLNLVISVAFLYDEHEL